MATATKKEKKQKDQQEDTNQITLHKVDPDKVKNDDLMSITHYVKVKRQSNGEVLDVAGLDQGVDSFQIRGRVLIENMQSADQYQETQTVTKTKAAEILVSAYGRPFTVYYEKQDGEKRILRGRLIQPEPLLGRSMCEDLDIKDGHRLRLVDHRTIIYLILGGIKYEVPQK